MSETPQLGYKFGTWQILGKDSPDLIIFPSHMKYGRKLMAL